MTCEQKERERVEEALTRIGRIALGGVGDNGGYIFYANDVRKILLELQSEAQLQEHMLVCPSCSRQQSVHKNHCARLMELEQQAMRQAKGGS